MNGEQCVLCEGVVETDSEDCLCQECSGELDRGCIAKRAVAFIAVIVVALVFMSMW